MIGSRASMQGERIHIVGIGGAGMSGLALLANALGADVTGSDQAASSFSDRVAAAGMKVVIGHDATNVPEQSDMVVHSTAIRPENVELAAAAERGIPIYDRASLLGRIAGQKNCIAVAGTHGKSTTTAMIVHVLRELGRRPSWLVGAEISGGLPNAFWDDGDWFVVEADESDGSFLQIKPSVAVVTNIELDHHSAYDDLAQLYLAFEQFIQGATVTVAAEGRWLGQLSGATAISVSYGIGEQRFAAQNATSRLAAEHVGFSGVGASFELSGQLVELGVPGDHNVLNALGAIAACAQVDGVDWADAALPLKGFVGAGRRFERKGVTVAGAAVVDDYAHHPTEVAATLAAARPVVEAGVRASGGPPGRLVAVLQPHLFSRTKMLAAEFGQALAAADVVVVTDIYAARERPEDWPGVSALDVVRAAGRTHSTVVWAPSLDQVAAYLNDHLREDDLCLLLGAGDICQVADRLLEVAA